MAKYSRAQLEELKKKYKYVVAWNRATGSFEYYVNAKVIQAHEDGAPENAYVYTFKDVQSHVGSGGHIVGVPVENGAQEWKVYDPETAKQHVKDIINAGLQMKPANK